MALPQPTSHLVITGDGYSREVEVFRCDTDGAVVFRDKGHDSQPLFRLHAGHKLIQPVVLKEDEIELIIGELNLV